MGLAQIGKRLGASAGSAARTVGQGIDYAALAAYLQSQQQPAPASYDPGYDSGSSYAEPAPAPPPPSLSTDPGWIALNAELDQELAMGQAEMQRRSGMLTANRDRLLGELVQRGELDRTQISGGMEARGLFGGGQMEEHLARQRANEAQRQTGINTDTYGALSDLQAQTAMSAQQVEARRAQARADYISRGYTQ